MGMTFSMDAHVIVVDLGFGDAGKGSIVDWLCAAGSANAAQGVHPANRQHRGFAKGELQGRALVGGPVKAVIRFNGGAQAGHNVVTPSGRHHTFSQFGSGTFHGVPTHLSRYMVVDPLALAAEASALGDPYHLLTIDPEALVVTPWHAAANRAKETLRGQDRPGPYPSLRDAPPGKPLAGRHGSCGMGVGEAVSFSLLVPDEAPRVADCRSPVSLRRKLSAVRDALGFPRPRDAR